MKVLLVNPCLSTVYNPFPYPPLGLMILAANIRDKHLVKILDRNSTGKRGHADLIAAIKKFKPDIIGVTSLTGKGIIDGLTVSKIAKKNNIKVVWGGTHASLFPKQTLKNPLIDFVVIGEGEITFMVLLDALQYGRSLAKIEGIGYKSNGKIKINPEREFIFDLDNYPMPAWDLVNVERYIFSFKGAKRKLEMVTSRGCPFRCAFCYNLRFNKRLWRGRSAPKIIEEINFLKKRYRIDCVRFADDQFAADKNRLQEFCQLNQKTGVSWDSNCRISDVSEKFLEMVAEGGCARLTFGVESGSDRILKFLKKDITVKNSLDAFELLSKTKIMTAAAFMIGLPTETRQEAQKTIKMAKMMKASHVHLYPYVPYPGGELSEYCLKEGLIKYPEKIEDWGSYSYIQQRPGIFTEKEIQRLTLYFQFRNAVSSLKRGEWGILKNFFNERGLVILKEMVSGWLGLKAKNEI